MKYLNIPLIVLLVAMPIYLGVNQYSVWIIVQVTMAISIALFFININKFEYFKFANMEAKLRDTIEKAYVALEELKDLGLSLSEPMIVNIALADEMLIHASLEYKLESVEKIANVLRKLGASENEINDACGFIYKRTHHKHVNSILHSMKPENSENIEIYKNFRSWDFSDWDTKKINDFISSNSLVVTDETKEWLEDFDYFIKTKKLRRSDQWNGRA